MQSRHILLGITGGIAAYKTPQLVRDLRSAGAEVQVVMSRAAQEFVTATSLQAVSGQRVRDDLWDPEGEAAMGHIELARWADLLLIAPATAQCLSTLAQGQAHDLLSTLYLATDAPCAVAPAMNQAMWRHPATARNVEQLRSDGVSILGPAEGEQACGDVGPGRMLEPAALVEAAAALLSGPGSNSAQPPGLSEELSKKSLAGKAVLITAGPTREALDPVRYLSNHSSGKQGFALAAAAAEAGALVTLIAGPVNLTTPPGVERIDVQSATQMHEAVMSRALAQDVVIGVAAVADYRPQSVAEQKIKKAKDGPNDSSTMRLVLVENPDIIASVAALAGRPLVVGFAAETHDALAHARAKRERKGLDLIVVNDVSRQDIGFGSDHNAATIIAEDWERSLERQPKSALAHSIVETIAETLRSRAQSVAS